MRVTLDDLQAEVAEEYQPLEIDLSPAGVVKLQPLLLFDRERRNEVKRQLTALREISASATEDINVEGQIVDILCLVADDPQLLRYTFSNASLALLQNLLKKYMRSTQPGEASRSAS